MSPNVKKNLPDNSKILSVEDETITKNAINSKLNKAFFRIGIAICRLSRAVPNQQFL